MTWKLTDYAKTRMPLPGVPWRDLSDDEFAQVERKHPSIRQRGYFVKESVSVTPIEEDEAGVSLAEEVDHDE